MDWIPFLWKSDTSKPSMLGILGISVDVWVLKHRATQELLTKEFGTSQVNLSSPQILTSQQLKQLTVLMATPPNDPIHHVVFAPGWKDRIKYTASNRRGHPQRYWYELNMEYALPVMHYYLDSKGITDHRRDALGFKQLVATTPPFRDFLESAPTRLPALFKRHAKHLQCAWQP